MDQNYFTDPISGKTQNEGILEYLRN